MNGCFSPYLSFALEHFLLMNFYKTTKQWITPEASEAASFSLLHIPWFDLLVFPMTVTSRVKLSQ
jgi:hypothetical protein